MSHTGTVYLLHFHGAPSLSSRHYIGWTTDLDGRLQAHAAGRGAVLLRELVRLGGSFQLVRTWKRMGRCQERRLHRRHQHARMCPICRPAALARHAQIERRRRKEGSLCSS